MIPNTKKIYLCSPDLSKLCVLNGIQTSTVDFHSQVKGYSELSFIVDRFISINGNLIESNGYNELKPYMYLLLEDIGYFIIEPPETSNNGNNETKSIVAYSAEKEFENKDWVGIKINYGTSDSMEYSNTGDYNIEENGFAIKYVTMYNEEDENLSFLTQILKKMSDKWHIQYISPSLVNAKIPFLEIDNENLYAIMTSEVAPRLSCIFIFDYLNFGISVFSKSTLENDDLLDTGIFIGFRNLENTVSISTDSDSIYTRFTVQGQDSLEFRDVNFGENTILNLDYFASDPYMEQETIDKYNLWKQFKQQHIDDYKSKSKQYNELLEKREERVYRVPSDEAYWTNWTNINSEGLVENLKYHRWQLEVLQMSVDEREQSQQYDEDGNYVPVLLYGDRLYKVNGLTTATRYQVLNSNDATTTVIDMDDPEAKQIVVNTEEMINCNIDTSISSQFIYVENFEEQIDHEYYLTKLHDKVNIYGGYYTYKETIDYIIPYIKLSIHNIDKTDDDKIEPEYDISQDWEAYGLEELKGVRDSYQDKIKSLNKYSKDYNEYKSLMQNINKIQFAKSLLTSYANKKFNNIDLTNREKYTWTEDSLQQYTDLVSKFNIKEGDISTILALHDSDFYAYDAEDQPRAFSVAYSPLLQTDTGEPIILSNLIVHNYISYILNKSIDINGKFNESEFYRQDSTGVSYSQLIGQDEYVLSDDDYLIKNIIANVCEIENQSGKSMYIVANVLNHYEGKDDIGALQEIATYGDVSLSNDYFDDKTIREAINDISSQMDDIINEQAENNNIDINYVDDGTGEKYESQYGRTEYKKLKEALGDKDTPGTILYQISVLENEIASIQEQMDQITKITNEYALIVKYNLDEDTLNSFTALPSSIIDERRKCLFSRKELLTIDALIRDTDYTNSNILASSIMSLDEKYQVQEELLADAEDKLSEVSQPQYTFSVDLDNFFRLGIYQSWANEFEPNNDINKPPIGLLKFIRVGIREDYSVKLRVIGYRWNPCEVTPDLQLEFSNMITSRSGRSDIVQLLDLENNRDAKNSISIGTGNTDVDKNYVQELIKILAKNSAFTRAVSGIAGNTTGQIDQSAVQGIVSDYIGTLHLDADSINVGNITGTTGEFNELFTKYLQSDVIYTKLIDADQGRIKELEAEVIKIGKENGDFTTITQDYIDTHKISADRIDATEAFVNEFLRVGGEDKITEIVGGQITTDTIISKLVEADDAKIGTLSANIIRAGKDGVTTIAEDYIKTAKIQGENITVDEALVSEVLRVGKTGITTIANDTITTENIVAKLVDADEVQARQVSAAIVTADSVVAGLVNAKEGQFENLTAENAFMKYLSANLITASEINVDDLRAKMATIDVADITQLSADSAFIKGLQSIASTSATSIIDDAYIYNAVANKITVSELKAGDIILGSTDDDNGGMKIISKNGAMIMNGKVLQFGKTDEETGEFFANIQLGYATDEKPSLIIRDEDGVVLFTSQGIIGDNGQPIQKGISAGAIANELIVNNMIQKGTIDADRLSFKVMEEGSKVTIEQIYLGDKQFGAEWTEFTQGTNESLNELRENIENSQAFSLYIETPHGTNISGGNIVLNARLFRNNEDVTSEYDDSCFTWTRTSRDNDGDIYWNANHTTGAKAIIITASDVRINADFQCKFEYENITVTSN